MADHKGYKIVEGETTFCGDHYCAGHYERTVVCDCGKECGSPTSYGQRPTAKDLHQEHRVAVALGEE